MKPASTTTPSPWIAAAALAASVVSAPASATADPAASPPLFDTQALAQRAFGADAPWYLARVPLLDTPDPLIGHIYHYRWQLLRAHLRDIGREGAVFTEFLPEVGWDRKPWNTINDSAAFPIMEGRWMRDPQPVDQFIDYLHEQAGNNRQYTEWVADAMWQRYRLQGDARPLIRHLPALRYVYNAWADRFDPARGLYWIEPLFDATEYTIGSIDASGGQDGFTGGQAFRPSINSYQYANARAISRIAALAGLPEVEADYAARATALKAAVQQHLWQPALGHFADRMQVRTAHVAPWDPVRGRELVGFVPWAFELPDATPTYTAAWARLLQADEFAGPHGLRTVGPGYEHYLRQYRYFPDSRRPECQWNGPVWPFQTAQVLTGLAHLLAGPPLPAGSINAADYRRLLRDYSRLHLAPDGRADLQEDYDPETGRAIVGDERSHHYLHSSYIDLVLGGLIGLRPQDDGSLQIRPLLASDPDAPDAWPWWAVSGIPWQGHRLDIAFDADGRHYGRGPGLQLWLDGRRIAQTPRLQALDLPAPGRVTAPAPTPRPNLAANIRRSGFPRPSASNTPGGIDGPQAADLWASIDGRLWFFPELPAGWRKPHRRWRSACTPALFCRAGFHLPARARRTESCSGPGPNCRTRCSRSDVR